MCLSCICLLAMHTLICVTFSLPPGVGGFPAASACGSSWTFLFSFLHLSMFSPRGKWGGGGGDTLGMWGWRGYPGDVGVAGIPWGLDSQEFDFGTGAGPYMFIWNI